MTDQDLVLEMERINERCKHCKACIEGKTCQKTHHRIKKGRAKKEMDLWHMDFIGPVRSTTKGGKNYVLKIIDDYSRFVSVALLCEKNEAKDES